MTTQSVQKNIAPSVSWGTRIVNGFQPAATGGRKTAIKNLMPNLFSYARRKQRARLFLSILYPRLTPGANVRPEGHNVER